MGNDVKVSPPSYANSLHAPVHSSLLPAQGVTRHSSNDGTEPLLSRLQKYFPVLPLWAAVLLAFFNLFIPGSGTFVAAFLACCRCCVRFTHEEQHIQTKSFLANFFFGLLQFATAWLFLLGYAWSIIWGFLFIVQACCHLDQYPPEQGCHAGLLRFIPAMPTWLGVVLLVVNVLLPGLGTILAGLFTLCCLLDPAPGRGPSAGHVDKVRAKAEAESAGGVALLRAGSRCGTATVGLVFGLLQLLLTVVVVGWFWSIYWASLFLIVNLRRRALLWSGETV